MSRTLSIPRSAIKVRKSLPSHLVVQRVFTDRRSVYRRPAAKRNWRADW